MQANNVNNAMRQLVVRISPITGQPVLFDALSKSNGQLQAWVNNESKTVGLDFYAASQPMDEDVAKQVVQAFAEQQNIPLESLIVRHRLPKSNAANVSMPRKRAPRKTNDANLKLVQDDQSSATLEQRVQEFHKSQKQSAQQRKSGDDKLANAVQALQDAHTSVHGKKEQPKQEAPQKSEQKASADKPEGAVVKRDEKQRTKRPYTKKPASERSAKSRAAYERYVKELGNQIVENPQIMEPVAVGPNVSEKDVEAAYADLGKAIARILKMPGIL